MSKQNEITINNIEVTNKLIRYCYTVSGPWKEAFDLSQPFELEYDVDVSDVPTSVAVIPLLGNVLPMAWVYDARIKVPTCDADFLNCLPEVKQGYEKMYPMMHFGGEVEVSAVRENRKPAKGAICFFSGGVDAFNTLIQHADERPMLLTMRGADIKLSDVNGWTRVRAHSESVANDFGIEFHEASSTFRTFLDEYTLSKRVAKSGDGWWHGFQHGLGILCHAAPLAWMFAKSTIYIASSFTAADKGKYTCASDPTIDNYVRFCGAHVVHDGYEFDRQNKVHNIVEYSRKTGTPIELRVCWESEGGSNCCKCEKCLRTILAVYAEGADPQEFGFEYGNFRKLAASYQHRFSLLGDDSRMLQRYIPIQRAMRKNRENSEIPTELLWFYDGDLSKLVHASLLKRATHKIIGKAKFLLH